MHLPEARKEKAKKMSGEEVWRKVELSGSLSERRSEEMTRSNILPQGDQNTF